MAGPYWAPGKYLIHVPGTVPRYGCRTAIRWMSTRAVGPPLPPANVLGVIALVPEAAVGQHSLNSEVGCRPLPVPNGDDDCGGKRKQGHGCQGQRADCSPGASLCWGHSAIALSRALTLGLAAASRGPELDLAALDVNAEVQAQGVGQPGERGH